MSGGSSDYIRRFNYTEIIDSYIDIIKRKNCWDSYSEAELHSYVASGGWGSRRSGRGIAGNALKYKEKTADGRVTIELVKPSSDWKEWVKTIGRVGIPIQIEENPSGATFVMSEQDVKAYPNAGKLIRQSLRKAAYCVGCRVCEINCKEGHIHFENGVVTIEDCIHCHECFDIPAGCYAFDSL